MEPTDVDLALREAIYFEALKEGEAEAALSVTDAVIAALVALLLRRGFTSFAEVTKRELNSLLTEARQTITLTLDKGQDDLVKRMQRALASIVNVHSRIAKRRSGTKITVDNFDGSQGANKALWERLTKDTLPGTGLTPREMLKDFSRATLAMLITGIKRAYADNWTVSDTVRYLKGTPARKFKDGALNKLGNQLKTMVRTTLAHAKAFVAYEISKALYDRYQWFSTIDSATTDICRSRHLKIYEYGRGPRPPAHFNCRSIIVGIDGDLSNMAPSSYWDWIRAQPAAFLKDVLTPAQARAIAEGSAKARDFPVYRNVRRITPAQYEGKFPRITAT